MASDNIELNAGSGGATLATAEVTFSGDTADVQICGAGIVSGSAESYSVTLVSAGAGVVGTGVQRMTLASDDPAVVALQLLDNAVSGAGYNITQFAGAAVPIGGGVEATALRVTVATDSTGVLSVDDNGGSLTVDGTFWQATQPVSNAGTFAVQVDGAALTALQLIDDVVVVLGQATYTETTSKGNAIAAVRNDTLSAKADTNNEFAPLQVSALGALWTEGAPSVVDSGNSTTIPLLSGVTFTGTGVDVLAYAEVTVNLFADQDSAAAGMRFEWSIDNTNWDESHQHDYIANTGRPFQFATHAQYFRVVFVNGATGQGAVRIQTILHRAGSGLTTIHRVDDTLAPDRSAAVVKSVLMAQAAGSGNFMPIDATAGGNLKVSVEEINGGAIMPVSNPGTFVVQENGVALTALQLIDDIVYVDDGDWVDGVSKHALVGGLYQVSPQSITDGDVGPIQVTVNGYQIVTVNGAVTVSQATHDSLNCNATIQIADADASNGNPVPVSDAGGTLTVDQTTHDNLNLNANLQVTNTDVAPTNPVHIASNTAKDGTGTAYAPLVDSDGHLQTDTLSIIPGTGATNLGKARASALGATDTGVATLAVRNDDLADLAGADGDYTPIQVDPQGAVYVNQAAAENKSASGVAAGGAPGTDDMIAAVAGKKILVTAMSLTATSTTVNNVFVDNEDNDLWHNTGNPFPMSTDADGDNFGGIVLPYNPAGWFKTDTDNEAVTLNSSAAQDIAWSISWIETD